MPSVNTVAIIDIGKTNAKVTLVAAGDASELGQRTTSSAVRTDGPYPHADVPRLWAFIAGALAELNRTAPIDAIVTTAHGSAGAFIAGDGAEDGLTMPVLDYEFDGPDALWADYDAVRPPFAETLSPRLPSGLNLGAQIFWQERTFPAPFAAARTYVNWPQYWSWRLSGVAATEMCSMGAHSDMWKPRLGGWSSLVERLAWSARLAPLRSAFDTLGPVRAALAQHLGLRANVAVQCGIHDSSASLLPYLKSRIAPFSVVSTGTWVILFGIPGDIERLDPARDSLANVSALGDPVACARFMGGREYERLTGGDTTVPGAADIARVLRDRIMALPTFTPGVGPFPKGTGRWTHDPATLTPAERNAAASLYLALMTAESLALVGAAGTTVIEGPFARNTLFCSALAARTGRPLEPADTGTGTRIGALFTATGVLPERAAAQPAAPLADPLFAAYAADWLSAAAKV